MMNQAIKEEISLLADANKYDRELQNRCRRY